MRIAPYGRIDVVVTTAALLAAAALPVYLDFSTPSPKSAGLAWLGLLPLAVAVFAVSFYRDPERTPPADPSLVVAPADGTITDITTVVENEVVGGSALRIGIFLSPLNVHVNRCPYGGTVEKVMRGRGRCLPATNARAILENVFCLVGLRLDDGSRMAVRQVTGALARRIVCALEPGRRVERGERFGMIKLGSRTELLVPAGTPFELLVKEGDRVRGGESALLRLRGQGAP